MAAGLAAGYPMLFQSDAVLMPETLYAFVVAAVLLLAYRAADKPSFARFGALGLAVGAAILTRAEAALLVVLLVVPLAARLRGVDPRRRLAARRRRGGRRRSCSCCLGRPATTRASTSWCPSRPTWARPSTGPTAAEMYNGPFKGLWRYSPDCFEGFLQPELAAGNEATAADAHRADGLRYARQHAGEVPGVMAVRWLRTFGFYDTGAPDPVRGVGVAKGPMANSGDADVLGPPALRGIGRGRPRAGAGRRGVAAVVHRRPRVVDDRADLREPALPHRRRACAPRPRGDGRHRARAPGPGAAPGLRSRPGPVCGAGRMTEVAVGGLESAAEPKPDADRFPCFDGFRAAAALSVLVLHVAGSSGETQTHRAFGPYLARLDVGVAVFFLISGFLLYRPFVAAHLAGGRAPAALPFFRRRFLRIYPAYWVATTAVVYVFQTWPGGSTIKDVKSFVLYYSLAHSYNLDTIFAPLLQAWTLATEVAFYLFLPAWALAALARRRPARHRRGACGSSWLRSPSSSRRACCTGSWSRRRSPTRRASGSC